MHDAFLGSIEGDVSEILFVSFDAWKIFEKKFWNLPENSTKQSETIIATVAMLL